MNIRTLQRGLTYCGRVKAVRQTYHVFQAEGYFFVLSFALSKTRRGSGYFNVVDTAAVDYAASRRKKWWPRPGGRVTSPLRSPLSMSYTFWSRFDRRASYGRANTGNSFSRCGRDEAI